MRAPHAIRAACAIGLASLAGTAVSADGLPTTFDGLVEAGIETSIAERATWQDLYATYLYDPKVLLETGRFEMELWAEVDGALSPTGETIVTRAELIGIYDFDTRIFTWGWAVDGYPALPRTAAQATRAYGQSHNIVELTDPTRQDRPAFGSISGNIATTIGDLVYEDTFRGIEQPNLMFVFGVTEQGVAS